MNIDFKVLQLCSGHLLCDTYPDNWFELTEQEQYKFINDNAWEHMEGADESFMIEQIDTLAWATQIFINDNYIAK